jgi:opacity protein-like surface antigen
VGSVFFDAFIQTKTMGETMKKTLSLLSVLMAAGVVATPVQAATQYVSGFGGVSWMNNMKLDELYQDTSVNHSYDYDLGTGFTVTGAIGCDYGSYRFEAEAGYQTNDFKSAVDFVDGVAHDPSPYVNPEVGSSYPVRGDVSVLSLMGNGYYDFDLGSKVELYATAGVGVAQVSFHDVNDTGEWVVTPPNGTSGSTDWVPNNDPGYNGHETTLAWQVGAGLAAPIADNVKLDLRYRYFATTDFTLTGDTNHALQTGNTNISSHSVLLGLRVDF